MKSLATKPQNDDDGLLLRAKSFLKKSCAISDDDVSELNARMSIRNYRKGQAFLVPSQSQREVVFVLDGAFRSYFAHGSKEVNYRFTFEGECLLQQSYLPSGSSASNFVEALEDSSVLQIRDVSSLLASSESRAWHAWLQDLLEIENRKLSLRIEELLVYDGRERYLKLLEENPRIFDRVPLYHIASYLGLEKETLSRLRKKITVEKRPLLISRNQQVIRGPIL